ncbi:MAG TPA: hypothetical protein VED37_21210 [Ktedonobacteraceae bacterium]|nr:hypothetical protein [Ktedonobacteraceae bacterium]
MSQHMEFSESSPERSGYSSGEYEGVPNYNYNDYSSSSKGQKLSGNLVGSIPGTSQRLALAIVSLVLWILFFLFVVGVIVTIGSVNQLLEPFLLIGFMIFTALVFLINILFNRK